MNSDLQRQYRIASEKLQSAEEDERRIAARKDGKLSERMGEIARAKIATAEAAASMARLAERMGL